MEILANLYKEAEKHLLREPRNWSSFMRAIAGHFDAHVAIYTISFQEDRRTIRDFLILASSDPKTTDKYMAEKIYRHQRVQETTMAVLEPARRTDVISDDEFRKLGPLADFMIPHGMFYVIAVPAVLSDGSFATMTAWRDEHQNDFSELEKQRLALFMRHLMAILNESELLLSKPEPDVSAFGKKWALTVSEIEILSALLQGMSLKDVAEHSGRSYGTVRWHVQNILEKCQVSSQKELLREFYRLIR
ncbi:MAG TPA: LuxR family transcriptional regulator [Aliiroseovarius sp.]|nr:LuxR family transcriptional regulator [Aliiroseovarius sp.]